MSTPRSRLFSTGVATLLALSACSPAGENLIPVERPSTTTAENSVDGTSAPPVTGEPSTPGADPGSPTRLMLPGSEPVVMAEGLRLPWSLVFVGDRPVFSQREAATISTIVDGEVVEIAHLSQVAPEGEGGLLGLAIHPDDQELLYVYYTSGTDNRVVSFPLEPDGGTFALGEETVLIDGIPKARAHNGGRLKFGPDGKLYITTGDASERPDSQDLDSLGGKILRLNPDGTVPEDNPWGTPVWSYGHRNVQGIAWDDSGTMWATEFGQNDWDELNIIEPGKNYGWPIVEGMGGEPDFQDPVIIWTPAEASPSGLLHKDGNLYVASLRGERMWVMLPSDVVGTATDVLHDDPGRLRDIVAAPDGTLWVLTSNGAGDRILSYGLEPA